MLWKGYLTNKRRIFCYWKSRRDLEGGIITKKPCFFGISRALLWIVPRPIVTVVRSLGRVLIIVTGVPSLR